MVKKINEAEFEQMKNDAVAVVDFSATWCGPCKMLAPVLEEVSEELGEQVSFYNVDIDECESLVMQYGIMSVPSVLIFRKGEKVDQAIGFQQKDKLIALIKENI